MVSLCKRFKNDEIEGGKRETYCYDTTKRKRKNRKQGETSTFEWIVVNDKSLPFNVPFIFILYASQYVGLIP